MTTNPPPFRMHHVAQGSAEWLQARCGVATASMFKVAREWVGGLDARQQRYVDLMLAGKPKALCIEEAGYKNAPTSETIQRALDGETVGSPSDTAMDYAFRLADERVSGELMDEGHTTWQMERGHQMEPDARRAHEIEAGVIVQPVGFITSLDGLFGASADGFIDNREGAEYKCLVSPKGVRKVVIGNDISEFIDQVQGGLWLSGFKKWHFCMYRPRRPLYWRVIERDEVYIEALQRDMWRFQSMVSEYEKTLRAA